MVIVKCMDFPWSSLAESCLLPSPGSAGTGQGCPRTPAGSPSWREPALTPAAGCGVFVCFLITGWGSSLLIFNLPFPPALCPYQIPPGIASLPASFSPKP